MKVVMLVFFLIGFSGVNHSLGQPCHVIKLDSLHQRIRELSYTDLDSARILLNRTKELLEQNTELQMHNTWFFQFEDQDIACLIPLLRQLQLTALVAENSQNFSEALKAYFEYLQTCEAFLKDVGLNNPSLMKEKAIALASIAGIYLDLNDFDQALHYFSLSNKIFHSNEGLRNSLAVNYSNMAALYEKKNDVDSALIYYDMAIETSFSLQDSSLLALNYGNKAITLMNSNQLPQAQFELENAIKITEGLANYPSLAYKYGNFGYLKFLMGDFNSAESFYLKGLELAEEYNMRNLKKDQLLNLSILYDTLGKPQRALDLYQEYVSLKDKIFNDDNIREQSRIEANYIFEKKQEEERLQQEKEKLQMAEKAHQQKLTFYFLLVVLVFLIALFIVFYRSQKLKAQKKEIESENKRLEIQYRLLRSQMNPHFLFNALNTINSYIMKEENLKASRALQKFSKLVRKLLNQSTKSQILLSEELEMVEQYIEIENMRFQKQFEYEIKVLGNLDSENLVIPGMIIQPFAENAILHGLMPSSEKGWLEIKVEPISDEKVLLITITDNGVGRKNKDKKSSDSHISLSTELITERLDLLRSSKGSLNIIDLKIGTKVELLVPFNEEF
ncbi:MAG: histidine kinase [Crocinitomicaceae bacterium]